MKRFLLLSVFFYFAASLASAQCTSGNCSTGNGTYKWTTGDMYVGDWVDGKRTGYGRYDWADGSYYIGYFKDDLLNGKGSYYAADGTSMIGTFENNNFLVPPADTTAHHAKPVPEDTAFGDILAEMERQSQLDSIAKASALKSAQRYDLCTVVQKLVNDFPNNFKSFQGPAQERLLNLSASWYSLLMVDQSVEAGINAGTLSGNNSFYNILYEGKDFDEAKGKYDGFVDLMKSCNTGCCTMVFDPYEYKGESYSSYSTSWLTFMVRDGYDGNLYSDLVIEIELMNQLVEDGWSIYLRMYHLSDLNNK